MYTLTQAKDLVINQGYAICNDDTVEKLNEVLKFCFPYDISTENIDSSWKYYFQDSDTDFSDMWFCCNIWHSSSINLSEIELPIKSVLIPANSLQAGDTLTIEMVIELRKQYPNNLDFGDAFDKLLNN